jgi:cystine transport system permease protein
LKPWSEKSVPHWLSLMIASLPSLVWACLLFTVPLTILSFVLGIAVGFGTALARLFAPTPLAVVFRLYVGLFRGTPLLVQLFLIFYGLPSVGIVLDAFPAALIGFTLNVGAYTSEIIRAVIVAVPKGQWEAAYSIGMTWPQAMRRTIVPQASRIAVPPLSNTFIALVKDTSLAAAITVPELFRAGQEIVATSYEPLILYIEVALIYLAVSSVLSSLQARLERRLSRYGGFIEAAS